MLLQFWTVTYWIFAPLSATSSTTALCSVAVSNFGAVQPSMYMTSAPSSAMMSVRSNWPKFSELMRKYAWSGCFTFTPGGT